MRNSCENIVLWSHPFHCVNSTGPQRVDSQHATTIICQIDLSYILCAGGNFGTDCVLTKWRNIFAQLNTFHKAVLPRVIAFYILSLRHILMPPLYDWRAKQAYLVICFYPKSLPPNLNVLCGSSAHLHVTAISQSFLYVTATLVSACQKWQFFIHTYVHREKVGAALPDHPSQASHCPQQLAPFRPVCPQDSGALGPGTYNLSTPPRYPLPLSSRAPVRFRCFLRRPWRLSLFVTSSPSWPTASRPWL